MLRSTACPVIDERTPWAVVAVVARPVKEPQKFVNVAAVPDARPLNLPAVNVSVEASYEIALSTDVSYLIANTDLTSIDSFAEISTEVSTVVSDFEAIYFKKVAFTGAINNTNDAFTLTTSVRVNSETVYLNGLLQEAGVEYTVASGVITFASAPQTGDKVVIYGVQ